MDLYARVYMGVEMSRQDALALPGLEKYAESVDVDPGELRDYWAGEDQPRWSYGRDEGFANKRASVLAIHPAGAYVDLCNDLENVMVLGVCLADYNVWERGVPKHVSFTLKELTKAEQCVFHALMLLGIEDAKTLASIRLYTPVTCSPT